MNFSGVRRCAKSYESVSKPLGKPIVSTNICAKRCGPGNCGRDNSWSWDALLSYDLWPPSCGLHCLYCAFEREDAKVCKSFNGWHSVDMHFLFISVLFSSFLWRFCLHVTSLPQLSCKTSAWNLRKDILSNQMLWVRTIIHAFHIDTYWHDIWRHQPRVPISKMSYSWDFFSAKIRSLQQPNEASTAAVAI